MRSRLEWLVVLALVTASTVVLPACAAASPPAMAVSATVAVGSYPQAGYFVATLPVGAQVVVVGSTRYYLVDGVFYRRGRGGYFVATAPVGATVVRLPRRVRVVRVHGHRYHVARGVHYRYDSRRKVWVVARP